MVNLLNYIIDYLKHAPIIVQTSWLLSAVLMLTIIFLVSYLKHTRSRLRIKERIEATYQKKYESDLIEYLYGGNHEVEISQEQQKIINYLNKCAESGLKRKIIIKTLLKLRNEISGEMADAIQKLYYKTNLSSQASSKLKSKEWDVLTRAIKELAKFEIKEVHDTIISHINHPKKEVRREVQMYLVKLFSFTGLRFLDILETPLSEWDQIQILEILKKTDNEELPDIKNWLQSPNDTVVSFAIKLAKIYNQFEAKEQIIQLFEHTNIEIRIQAIEIVTHLGIYEAIKILKLNSNYKSIEEQIAFFKMGEKMFTILDLPYIKDHIDHENFNIRTSIKKTLETLEPLHTFTIQIDRNSDTEDQKSNLIKAS